MRRYCPNCGKEVHPMALSPYFLLNMRCYHCGHYPVTSRDIYPPKKDK